MPPSLPTGTVSQTSAGTRTFPPESTSDSDRERVSVASTAHRRPPQPQQLPTPSGPSGPPSPVIPRREHAVAVAREHDRVDELARENRALREYIREQATDKQAVIERYERLLEQRDTIHASNAPSEPNGQTPAVSPSKTTDGLVDSLATGLSTLRSRAARWLGLD